MTTPATQTPNSTARAATIKPKDRDGVLQALRAGVVPRTGVQLVQVGRVGEISQVVQDIERIADHGSAVRFIIGDYGSGKTFFLNLARSIALQSKLVVVNADLSPDRRIHATGGQARSLYAELMRNMATRTKQDGGALASVVERFIMDAKSAATASGRPVATIIQERLLPIQELVSGYDFATVIERYANAFETGNEIIKAAALRWLRGEYNLKTEARDALGVRSIIDDASVYDYFKVMGRFVTLAGYAGFFIMLDECVNLFKLVSAQSRNANYEQILRIVNDVLQGTAESFGVYFGGTPEFLMDSRRGLYSYEALRSRLAENSFARNGLVDLSGPVIRLQSLTPEDLYILLGKLRNVFASGNPDAHLVPDDAFSAFMTHCNQKIGDAYFRTPRNTIKAFLDLLAILEQNPGTDWRSLIAQADITADQAPTGGDIDDEAPTPATQHPLKNTDSSDAGSPDDDLESFRL
ncbi:ATP-binding protein [Acetobacter fallax]|uniref:ATP-binding protein n=1 Tax=Acetobacter fallax TaxID=1737473 RepID=A0ABX0K501_9PROT|nr:ATP-binding protein [Acetobacter fallax]NHO31396.1 ATP-binding protein [Acetobacter fallax]NHO35022.1 ATP-binding protein [Acetobacter fallax]